MISKQSARPIIVTGQRPLRALFDTQKIHKGGFYHDGRFATLSDVVNHHDSVLELRLTEQEKNDLIEYLKSI